MSPDHDCPAVPLEPSREGQLTRCLRRLLNSTELNMDNMEEETREAIREVLSVLNPTPANGS